MELREKIEMKVKWRKLIANILIWAIAEVALNFIGLDTLADYSEFIQDRHKIVYIVTRSHQVAFKF